MLEGLNKRYQNYEETEVPWLGKAPKHWLVQRTKWWFSNKKELNSRGENNNILSLTLRGVVNNDPENPEGLVPKDYRTYQIFCKHDLVFKLIDLENLRTSRVGLVHENGIMSSAYVRLIPKKEVNVKYFFYQFYDFYLRGVYNQLGAGVRSTLGVADLLNLNILIPSLDEQEAIVKFLDYANGKIDRAIHAKRETITLLNEQKQAIIHRAVTRGLDPLVDLKDTGVSWISKIPSDWHSLKIRNILFPCHERNRADLKLLSVVREKGVIIRNLNDKEDNHNFIPEDLSNYKVVRKGQFVMNKMKAWQGSYGVSNHEGIVSPAYFVFNLKNVTPEFFHLAIRSKAYVLFFLQASDGVRIGQWDLSIQKMKEISFFYPSKQEQEQIVEYINEKTKIFSVALSRLAKEIDFLTEYRIRLISDVVTGKLDVREAAKNLPAADVAASIEDDMDELENEGLEDAA